MVQLYEEMEDLTRHIYLLESSSNQLFLSHMSVSRVFSLLSVKDKTWLNRPGLLIFPSQG